MRTRTIIPFMLLMMLVLISGLSATAPADVNHEMIIESVNQGVVSQASDAARQTDPGTGETNPWAKLLRELLNQVAAYAVPLALALFFGWLGKRLGFDIPQGVQDAIEAFIFKVLAQIKAENSGKSNQQLQQMAATVIKNTLPNKLMKVVERKYGSAEGAIEYYYPRWVGMKKGAV